MFLSSSSSIKDNRKIQPAKIDFNLIIMWFIMFYVEHYLPKYTSNTDISAGDTPEILDAWAIVLGEYFLSF